jgi:hypothetical protein
VVQEEGGDFKTTNQENHICKYLLQKQAGEMGVLYVKSPEVKQYNNLKDCKLLFSDVHCIPENLGSSVDLKLSTAV